MSKYKDADRLMAILTKRCVEASNQEAWFAYAKACGDVRDLPAADVVEVVRCRDCKHNPMRSFTGCPMAGIEKRKTTDYCSYGERKDG